MPLLAGCVSIGGTSPKEFIFGNTGTGLLAGRVIAQEQDSDLDGVLNDADLCILSRRGSLVDSRGCPLVTGVIENLTFSPDDVELSEKSQSALEQVLDGYLRYPDITLAVEGHTDNRGSAAENLKLSKQRVASVVAFMVRKGVSADRIKPFAFGESRPRAPNSTLEGRELNRRIEIFVVEGLL